MQYHPFAEICSAEVNPTLQLAGDAVRDAWLVNDVNIPQCSMTTDLDAIFEIPLECLENDR